MNAYHDIPFSQWPTKGEYFPTFKFHSAINPDGKTICLVFHISQELPLVWLMWYDQETLMDYEDDRLNTNVGHKTFEFSFPGMSIVCPKLFSPSNENSKETEYEIWT